MTLSVLRRRRFLLGGLAAYAAASTGTAGQAGGARSGPWCRPLTKAATENAFDFGLYLLDPAGAVFDLGDLEGRPVWLNFFTSWCPPCNSEAADIVRISKKYGDALHVVGIDVREKPEQARAFRDLHSIPYPIALDSTGAIFTGFGLRGLPTHVFIDADGFISCVSVGDLTAEQMDNEVAVALARVKKPQGASASAPEPTPTPSTTAPIM